MIDIEALLNTESVEELKELKLFLFRENIRLENERREIADYKEKLIRERAQFRDEMDMLNHRIVLEKKRMKDDKLFFDKKMEILKEGYRQLDLDRQKLSMERQRFEQEKDFYKSSANRYSSYVGNPEDIARALFSGVNNPLTLRKRYKDLLKIFHPDNLCGDAEIVQMINREYEKRKRAE